MPGNRSTIDRKAFEAANKRAAIRRASGPVALNAVYDKRLGRILIRLSTGIDVAFAPTDAQGIETAKPSDLGRIEISPSGLGIHFPRLDADLYLPALLEGFLGSQRWAAARLGKSGGAARSRTKAAAARRNGKLGGRPKKSVSVAAE